MALWATFLALLSPYAMLTQFAESGRNLAFLGFMYGIMREAHAEEGQRPIKSVYAAVAAAVGVQIAVGGVTAQFQRAAARLHGAGFDEPAARPDRRCRRTDPRPQSLRPGRAGLARDAASADDRAGGDVGVRPPSLHRRLFHGRGGPRGAARPRLRLARPAVRARRAARAELDDPALARGDLPVGLADRDPFLPRRDDERGTPGFGLRRRMGPDERARPDRADERGGLADPALGQRAGMAQGRGSPSMSSSIATTIAANGAASPTRSGASAPTGRRWKSGSSRVSPTSPRRRPACCCSPTRITG